jgi:hypothetical protein
MTVGGSLPPSGQQINQAKQQAEPPVQIETGAGGADQRIRDVPEDIKEDMGNPIDDKVWAILSDAVGWSILEKSQRSAITGNWYQAGILSVLVAGQMRSSPNLPAVPLIHRIVPIRGNHLDESQRPARPNRINSASIGKPPPFRRDHPMEPTIAPATPLPPVADAQQLAIIQRKLMLDSRIRTGIGWFFLDCRAVAGQYGSLFTWHQV